MITVPLADYQREQSRRRIFQRALIDVAERLNRMADEIERDGASWLAETAPAPLDEAAPQTVASPSGK
jgi:hypothetical protein